MALYNPSKLTLGSPCFCGWVGTGPCPCVQQKELAKPVYSPPPHSRFPSASPFPPADAASGVGPLCGPATPEPKPEPQPKPEIKYGWQCPVCMQVHAPFMPSCFCHQAKKETES